MDLNLVKTKLEQYLKERTDADEFSGAVLVAKDGKSIFQKVTGFANKKKQIPNKINTKFNLGSANKMFTGVGVAQLVDQGFLSFDDKIGKFLPDYPNQIIKDQVTIHHLLTHTSGLGSFIDIKYHDQFLAARENLKNIQAVVDLFKDRPLEYPVGEVHYSSDGFELLGLIIETISKEDYFDYVKDNIFKKANMINTDSFEIDPKNVPDDIAVGYGKKDGQLVDNLSLNFLKGTASGAGYSTCPDLLNFTQALLNNQLLSQDMTKTVIEAKVQDGKPVGNQTKYYGYGFQVFDVGGVKRVGHPGRFAGVNTRIDMYPELGYTVIVLANCDPPSAFNVAEKIGELIISLGK